MTDRLAVLIDADNTSHRYVGDLLAELAKYGRPTVKRAYGDWTADGLRGWKAKLNRHAISPEQTFAYTVGKNSTDSALIIDAMDLLYSGNVDAFAIVSSDSDFTRLATRLRESGRTVYAVGRSTTPIALQEACDRFIRLELLDPSPEESAGSDDEGWIPLATLGNYLRTASPTFDPRLYGFPRLLPLVEAQAYLTTTGTGGGTRVGLKGKVPDEPPAKKAAPKKKATTKKAAPSK